MTTKRVGTSVFQNGLIWFGAAVSIAEIETGTQFASFANGNLIPVFAAIILGHLIGGILLFLAGLIGAYSRESAMSCVRVPFGIYGARFFAVANILQLIGWTAVMVASGAAAAAVLIPSIPFAALAVAIGLLVALWIFIGLGNVTRVNSFALFALFLLTLFLCFKLFGFSASGGVGPSGEAIAPASAFWAALELSIAMPLSWLPLIADYTKDSERPFAASAASAIVYTIVSIWMYSIGLGVAFLCGGKGFADSILLAGVGIVGILVVVFSTVTTTFLDAYSAGESAFSLSKRLPPRWVAVTVSALGTLIAIFVGMDMYINFLYLIASIFAPMAAVLIVDWFVVRRRAALRVCSIVNLFAWLIGLVVYHLALKIDFAFGATLPSMIIAGMISLINLVILGRLQSKKGEL